MDRILTAHLLLNGSEAERLSAVEHAARHPEQAGACAAALARCAADANESIAINAAEALEMLGPPPSSVLPELLQQLTPQSEGEMAYWTVTLIGRLGPQASNAAATLAHVLEASPYLPVRERAAWALGRIGSGAKGSEAALRSAAQNGPPRLARLATQALESIRGMAA